MINRYRKIKTKSKVISDIEAQKRFPEMGFWDWDDFREIHPKSWWLEDDWSFSYNLNILKKYYKEMFEND